MANYLKATDFGAKDALISGDPNKIIKGTEINDEFDSIQTAVNSKANTNNAALTGTPIAPTAATGTDTTQLATTAFVNASIDAFEVQTADIADDAVTSAKMAATGVTAGSYGSSAAIPVVTVNAEGQVTAATTAAITIADPIGVGQTWQAVSRAVNTNYTNSTGRPIMVSAGIYYGYDGTQAAAVVGGVTICTMRVYSCCGVAVSVDYPISFIVPAGATYRINGGAVRAWAELR